MSWYLLSSKSWWGMLFTSAEEIALPLSRMRTGGQKSTVFRNGHEHSTTKVEVACLCEWRMDLIEVCRGYCIQYFSFPTEIIISHLVLNASIQTSYKKTCFQLFWSPKTLSCSFCNSNRTWKIIFCSNNLMMISNLKLYLCIFVWVAVWKMFLLF